MPGLVERARESASQVTATWPITNGSVSGVAVDPIVAQAFVTVDDSLLVLDMASRETIDRVSLPGHYPRVAADPWRGSSTPLAAGPGASRSR